MKKALSLLLVLVMLLGMMPMQAFATEGTEPTEETTITEPTEATEETVAAEVTEATEVPEETEATEATEAAEVIEETEATEVVEVIEETEATEAVEAAHEHEYVSVVTAPTCTEQGYTTYTCICGDSYVDDYVDAYGLHDVDTDKLYNTISVRPGLLDSNTDGKILNSDIYGFVVNYPLKKGHVLSISDENYVFSVRKLENGSYSTLLKSATSDSYTATEDMTVGMLIRKPDKSAITAAELENIVIYDSQFGMIGVEGSVKRFTVEAETIEGGTSTTRAAIFLPESYSDNGDPSRLIIMTNGGSAYLTESSWQGNTDLNRNLIDLYLQNEYAVLVNDNTAGKIVNNTNEMVPDLGCLQQLSGLMKSYEYVYNTLNLEHQFSIHARSQGTFVGIRIMREYPELVKCALVTGPNVSAAHRWTVITNKNHAAKRFGFSDLTGKTFEADKFVGNDIYTDMAADDYSLQPTFWMESNNDVCPNNNKSIYEVVERLRELGCNAEYQKFGNLTHSETCRLASKEAATAALAFLNKHQTHTHSYTPTVTAPTCNEQGYTTYTCGCGDSYVDDYADAAGHIYENGTCTGCGATVSPYLQQLPENLTGCTNLYDSLTPVKGYYTATKYDTSNGAVLSVVIPVEPGDRIAASSFASVSENMGSVDGIRVTYLLGDKIVTSLSAGEVYNGYTRDGYITVPDGVDTASIPWWKPSDHNWLTLSQISRDFAAHSPKTVPAQEPTCTETGYTAGEVCEICNASLGDREIIPSTGHSYNGDTCTICGTVNELAVLDGKYVSILGDSISTFNGYSNDASVNTTIGGNGPRYDAGTADTKPGSYCLLESVDQTWWMYFANRSGMELLVNNSWAGSQVFGGKTSDGRVIPAAYLDRCVNLHDNTLENNPGNAPVDPDVIFVYLGINDYNFNRSKVGAGAVDYAGLVNSDGTYAAPTTFGEAYGIMLHKMQKAYPDAEIFAMTLLPENLYSVDKTAWEQHNAYIRGAAEYYGIPVVDLAENCAITWENYSGYMIDKIHPTTAGMELISDCIEAELTAYYKETQTHTHFYENGICTGCGEEDPNAAQPMSLRYDDHYDITGKTVEIIDAGMPASYQVGYGVAENTVLDTAVVAIEGDYLVATGIGTAKVKIDGELYEITVTAAPISLLLLIGQSNMQGSEGDGNQSIVCPDGMVYSTYGDRYTMTTSNATSFAPSALTGVGSTVNVNGTTTHLEDWPVYLLNEAGAGKAGPDSGYAYEWVKQTGEKVWVVNTAHGGTSINAWQDGGTQYEECISLFKACQETLRKEIAAGHFTLSHTGYFWCQGCADETQTAEWYVKKYLSMHDSLKKQLAMDFDGDGDAEELEFSNITVTMAGHVNKTGYRYEDGLYNSKDSTFFTTYEELEMRGQRVAQYWLASNPDYPEINMVCNIGEGWVTMPDGTNGVKEYFQSHYKNGTVDYKTQVQQSASWYTPSTPKAVKDSIHYNQIGYNEIGIEAARNTLILLSEIADTKEATTVKFVDWTGYREISSITASERAYSGTLVVPIVYPCYRSKQVSYQLSDGLMYEHFDLLASTDQMTGAMTAVGAVGSVSVKWGHIWSEWTTISKPSVDGPGMEKRICSDCGETESREVKGVWQTLKLSDHMAAIPEEYCFATNLWSIMEHDKYFFNGTSSWNIHASGTVYSITIPINPGDKIFATSFGAYPNNGGSKNGIRCTFFDAEGVVKTYSPADTYKAFADNGGYLVAPKGAVAVNIPMWNNDDCNEVYVLNYDHIYENGTCTGCGEINGPVITQQAESVEQEVGKRFAITVKAEGEALSYQWYYKDSGMKSFGVSSNKTSSYAYTMQAYMHNRQVYCVVTDANGNSVQTETATITRPPVAVTIIEQPKDAEANVGEKFSISPKVEGDGLTYQWYVKESGAKAFKVSSIKASAYALTMQKYMNGRQVYCVITDKYGNSVTTDVATISLPPVELKILQQPTDVYAAKGEKYSISPKVQGEGLTYQWYYKESYMKTFKASSNKSSAYAYSMQSYMNNRSVYCVITDKFGNQVQTEAVTIHLEN